MSDRLTHNAETRRHGDKETRRGESAAGGMRTTAPGARRAGWLAPLVPLSPCLLVSLSTLLLPGCIGAPANPSVKQPTTKVDPDRAQQWYWYNRPATVAVDYPQFDPLWRAAGEAVRDAGYIPDRRDFRNGVMTTKPGVRLVLTAKDVTGIGDLPCQALMKNADGKKQKQQRYPVLAVDMGLGCVGQRVGAID